MNILLAVDDSPFSRHMLAWLGAHQEWLSREQRYAVVHAQTPLPNGLRLLLDDNQAAMRRISEANDVFRPVRIFLERHGIRAEYFHNEGPAANVIVEQATQWHADMIVMGSRGHGAIGQLALGSVVSRVLASAPVPVVVIPPPRA
ncbi:universal stress protein [Piscinibacter sp. HJYY11]|uniref:universal stress protein n=1 Tax=Piscinibacter sp. HJYY11 TaxID=2801333 RepID=UPI00191E3A8F|nr:universal stress protein [Piscinibacter sp. HJYY11]MBL0726626.1 universal stress protein [Piscinibacter sp. HJYY11]